MLRVAVLPLLLVIAAGPAHAQADPARRHGRSLLSVEGSVISIQPKELERPLAPPAPPPTVPSQLSPTIPPPAPITTCDPNGCRDSSGTRYNGWGPGMIRSDGKPCQQIGNTMQCN